MKGNADDNVDRQNVVSISQSYRDSRSIDEAEVEEEDRFPPGCQYSKSEGSKLLTDVTNWIGRFECHGWGIDHETNATHQHVVLITQTNATHQHAC